MCLLHIERLFALCAQCRHRPLPAIEVIAAVNCLFINPCPPSQERGVAAAAAGKQGRLVCRWPQPAAVRVRTLGRGLYAYEAVCRGPSLVASTRNHTLDRRRTYPVVRDRVHLVFIIMPQAYWCEPHEAGLSWPGTAVTQSRLAPLAGVS